jgi:hypothetical protein
MILFPYHKGEFLDSMVRDGAIIRDWQVRIKFWYSTDTQKLT